MSSLAEVPHVADQAGGEVIFASDGLDPLPVPQRPILAYDEGTRGGAGENKASLHVEDSPTAEQAFEVFAGKVFPTKGTLTDGISTTRRDSVETHWQRLNRLAIELNDLEREVSQSGTDEVALKDQLHALREKLENPGRFLSQRQTLLTGKINKSATDTMASSSSSKVGDASNRLPQTSRPTTESVVVNIPSDWENRLSTLEAVMGTTVSSGRGKTMMERLHTLEEFASKLDEKQCDIWQKKAKTIRQDLEAASKARNKLMASNTSSQDAKTIADLYDLSQQLRGMSDHLPFLVQRLQALAHLHTDAASWSTRLKESEDMALRLDSQVSAVEKTVEKMEISFTENATRMQANMTMLDERLKQISK